MPESISSCGVLNAPPARMTSRARMTPAAARPAASLGVGVRAVEPLRPSDTRRRRRGCARRTARASPARRARCAAGPDSGAATSSRRSRVPIAPVVAGGQRRVADAVGVVGGPRRRSFGSPALRGTSASRCSGRPLSANAASPAASDAVAQLPVAERRPAGIAFSVCSQPSPAMPGRIDAELGQQRAAPGGGGSSRAAGSSAACCRRDQDGSPVQRGDVVPVGVVRVDQDHRVVRGAAAERAGARIEHAVAGRPSLLGIWDRAAAVASSA